MKAPVNPSWCHRSSPQTEALSEECIRNTSLQAKHGSCQIHAAPRQEQSPRPPFKAQLELFFSPQEQALSNLCPLPPHTALQSSAWLGSAIPTPGFPPGEASSAHQQRGFTPASARFLRQVQSRPPPLPSLSRASHVQSITAQNKCESLKTGVWCHTL